MKYSKPSVHNTSSKVAGKRIKMNRNICTKFNLSESDSERFVDQLIIESDDTYMACPTIDSEPDLLISKVSIMDVDKCKYLPTYNNLRAMRK